MNKLNYLQLNKLAKIPKLFLLIIISFAFSCNKFNLDINESPNSILSSTAKPFIIFPAATMSTVAYVGGPLNLYGGLWSQFWTQSHLANQYKEIVDNNVNSQSSTTSNIYSELFAGALTDYQTIIDYANKTNDYKYYREATALKVYTYQILVDLYDNIPYTEALKGGVDYLLPKYDAGYDIYKDLIKNLDEAFSRNYSNLNYTAAEKSADLIFKGDTTSWRTFANTLKLKLYLRLVNKYPTEAEAGIRAMIASNAKWLTSNAGINIFKDEPNTSNPLYENNTRRLNVKTNLQPCYSFTSWLSANNDLRGSKFFSSTNTYHFGDYDGNKKGGLTYPPTVTEAVILNPTDPVYLISAAESEFLQAEVATRYSLKLNGKNDKSLYESAVTSTYVQWGLTVANATTALTENYPFPTTNIEDKIKSIIMQKRIALYKVNSIEAFFDRNRTGYPEYSSEYSSLNNTTPNSSYIKGQLVSPPNNRLGLNLFPARFPLSNRETTTNTNAPTYTSIDTRVWWAK